jgi:very-short-patch-repair endonuclease
LGALARLALSRREIPAASPFDRFVVDFYCHAAKLVIDPRTAIRGDGQRHEWFSDRDAGRTEILERLGPRVVRFTNKEVSDDLASVLARIRAELRLPFDRGPHPLTPCPSSNGPAGEG